VPGGTRPAVDGDPPQPAQHRATLAEDAIPAGDAPAVPA
jgi:hypothetical protein